MAPVQLEPEIRYDLVGLVFAHDFAALWLTFEVGRSLYRSYCALGPAQDTRERRALRKKLIPAFAILAFVSWASSVSASTQYAALSYKVWASQRNIEIPTGFWGNKNIIPFNKNTTNNVFRWITDTPVYTDAIEILSEKARRFWWGQQVDLGMISWSLLLAIEGRRRHIPLLWSYQLLGQLVSLAYAQNLFFIALLLTPAPLPRDDGGSLPVSRYVRIRDAIFTPKPAHWTPHPLLYFLILVPRLATIALSTFVANTPLFNTVYVAGRASTLAPLVLPYVVPKSWGKIHQGPHEVYDTYEKLFKTIAIASLALHAKATVIGLAYNAPDAHYHRHSIHLPFDTETRSPWERTTSAFGRILEATSDHPVVRGVGWDVLLSALSIGLWASVRSTDPSSILASTIPFYGRQSSDADESNGDSTKEAGGRKAITSGSQTTKSDEPSTPRRRGRPRKIKEEDPAYEPTASEAADIAEGDVLPGSGETGWDSTALAWGLTVLGGLGVGSAGVFGAECIAR